MTGIIRLLDVGEILLVSGPKGWWVPRTKWKK